MLLLALSTGHKAGLALAVAGFAGFSLVVSMLVPRWYPQFPGRGLRVFLVAIILLFVGMMSAVIVFGRESGEERAEGKGVTGATETRTTPTQTTSTTQTTPSGPISVKVTEVDFKIQLPKTSFPAGSFTFDVTNAGKVPHDLVVKGNGVSVKTPLLNPGESKTLKVELKPGTYELYCSVPGHKQLGMDLHITVSTAASATTAPTTTTTAAGTASTPTSTTQTTPSAKTTVKVTEVDFKIQLPKTSFPAGSFTFDVKNAGKVPHDLVVKGNGVNAKTPLLDPGQSKTLGVDLKPGTYELYCSVPGHKQLGMDLHITVS